MLTGTADLDPSPLTFDPRCLYVCLSVCVCVCVGNMKQLLVWIGQNLLKERPELFVQGDDV